jgi:hypothetical protein
MQEMKTIYLFRYHAESNPELGYEKRVYVEEHDNDSDIVKETAIEVLSDIAKDGVTRTLEEIADEVEEVLNATFDLYRLPITNSIDRAVILTATSMYDLPCVLHKAGED